METIDSQIEIYGLSVGDEITQNTLREQMEANGYTYDTANPNEYSKGIVSIQFATENDIITLIYVMIEVTNNEGILF